MPLIHLALEGGADRRNAMLQAGAYLLAALFAAVLVSALARRATQMNLIELGSAALPQQLLAKLLLLLAFAAIPTLLCALAFRQPLARFGLSPETFPAAFPLGLALGAGCMALCMALIAASARTTVTLNVGAPPVLAAQLLFSVAIWFLGALVEEMTFRGYMFMRLTAAWSFWPAAILSSLAFMLIHLRPGEPPTGALTAGLLGLLFCLSVRAFGSIWFAVAFHMAWNFCQSFVFGVANSGGRPPAMLSSWRFEGPGWLTGGATGPEGSLVALAVAASAVALFAAAAPAAAPPMQAAG